VRTHKSGWLYDRIGLPESVPTNARRLPSGLIESPRIGPSMLAILVDSPPAAATEWTSLSCAL